MLKGLYRWIRDFARFHRSGGVVRCTILNQVKKDRFLNYTVIVTGGTSGIGYEIAKELKEEGATVIIIGRIVEKCQRIAKELECDFRTCDVTSVECINSVIKDIFDKYQNVDLLVNNAGIYSTEGFFEVTEDIFNSVMNTNLRGPFFCSQSFLREIRDRNTMNTHHKIINIVSNRGNIGDTNPYGLSKWGLRCFTIGLAKVAGQYNTTVNGISPGVTASAINNADIEENAYYPYSLDKRIAAPNEIAELVKYLASDLSNHIKGQIITIDGGESIC